jgi:trk system potassium uptake protein TrkH
LHWVGGLGVIVLVTAVLPLLGVGGRQMFKAETPTPMKDQKLTPRMAETAKGLWVVYVILTTLCISASVDTRHELSSMPWCTRSRSWVWAGFSSHDASLGHFDSLQLEIAWVCSR